MKDAENHHSQGVMLLFTYRLGREEERLVVAEVSYFAFAAVIDLTPNTSIPLWRLCLLPNAPVLTSGARGVTAVLWLPWITARWVMAGTRGHR